MNKKTTFIIGAVVLAAGLVLVLTLTEFPPSDASAVGTIGAADTTIAGVEPAQRYRTEQISDEAVTLDNSEIQELLQDDEVLKVVQDPEFQRALSNEDLSRVLQHDAFQRALQGAEFQRALARTTSEQLSRAEMSRQQREDFARTTFARNESLARAVAQNEDLARSFARNEALARAVAENDALARAVAENVELQRAFASRQALELMSSLQRSEMFRTVGFQRLMQRQMLARMAQDPGFSRSVFARAQQMELRTAQ